MPTKVELEEQVAALQEALEEAHTLIDNALGIEADDPDSEDEE